MIASLRLWNRDDIPLIILRYFSDLSRVLLGREHPLARIFGWYDLLYASNFDEIVCRCMEGITDHFESFVGAIHTSILEFRIRSFDFVSQRRIRIEKVKSLLSECEGTFQPYDDRVCLVRDHLAFEDCIQHYFIEAKTLSQENFANSHHIRSEQLRLFIETNSLYIMAMCQYALGEVDLGIANLNEAINSRISIWGPQDALARSWLIYLEDWHLEQGNWDHVEQIRDRRMRTLPPTED